MKETTSSTSHTATAKRPGALETAPEGAGSQSSVKGLRTGKIHAERASASQIRKSVGVRPSEEKIAAKALLAAGVASKSSHDARIGTDKNR